jgi:hypothetical protein
MKKEKCEHCKNITDGIEDCVIDGCCPDGMESEESKLKVRKDD